MKKHRQERNEQGASLVEYAATGNDYLEVHASVHCNSLGQQPRQPFSTIRLNLSAPG